MEKLSQQVAIVFVLIGVMTVGAWSGSPIPIMNSTPLVIWILFLFLIYSSSRLHSRCIENLDSKILKMYFLWLVFNIIRGAIVYAGQNYWIWKNLIESSLFLCFPAFIILFSQPIINKHCIKLWLKWGLIFFAFWFVLHADGMFTITMIHFGLAPILLLGCFAFSLPKKWRYFVLFVIIVMITLNMGARSMIIKALSALMAAIAYLFHKKIPVIILKIVHLLCYFSVIIFLFLGITGQYNILSSESDSHQGKYTQQIKDTNGNIVDDDAFSDTRTFIYIEVIQSAINNDYVICGRTPARGNDSLSFGDGSMTGYKERSCNELLHPSVFTWLGLIGVGFFFFFYFRASYLGVYKSKSMALKILGCYVAFRWAYGWLEDAPSLNINTFALWMMIGICLSKKFRNMNDKEFVEWMWKALPYNKKLKYNR